MAHTVEFELDIQRHPLDDEGVYELLEFLSENGPYISWGDYNDTFIAFSDPEFTTEGFRSYEEACDSLNGWHYYQVYCKYLEKECAIALTIATLRNMGLTDDEIYDYFEREGPEFFEASNILVADQLKFFSNKFFTLPRF